jgi:hypothetical protein
MPCPSVFPAHNSWKFDCAFCGIYDHLKLCNKGFSEWLK